jgi:two-component system, chemotaxis family, response regulator Rcp1
MPVDVLLAEDNPGDVRMMREVMLDVNRDVRLHVASDGVEAVAFLKREGIHARAPRPSLIFLDLHLPKMDGRDVITRIKADENLRMIPIIVLTSSQGQLDIVQSYELRASCYVCKPPSLKEFESLLRSINDFWLTKVKLPKQPM